MIVFFKNTYIFAVRSINNQQNKPIAYRPQLRLTPKIKQ